MAESYHELIYSQCFAFHHDDIEIDSSKQLPGQKRLGLGNVFMAGELKVKFWKMTIVSSDTFLLLKFLQYHRILLFLNQQDKEKIKKFRRCICFYRTDTVSFWWLIWPQRTNKPHNNHCWQQVYHYISGFQLFRWQHD